MQELMLMNGGLAVDDRGSLRFCNQFDFKDVKRFYQVENHDDRTVRAWHGHRNEAKYVYVAYGSAIVGAVRMDSEEAAQRFVMSAQKPQILYIPPGFANGFKALEPDTIIMFFSTATLEESKNDDIRFPYDQWDIWDVENR